MGRKDNARSRDSESCIHVLLSDNDSESIKLSEVIWEYLARERQRRGEAS